MKLTANGMLRHCFFGDYSAVIALRFEEKQDAELAIPQLHIPNLGAEWTQAGNGAVITVNSDQLNRVKDQLAELGADPDAIDSVAHSTDFGDPFSVTVEVEDPRQVLMF